MPFKKAKMRAYGNWLKRQEAYNEAIAEGMSPSEATEEAEMDMTYTESGYIPSWEWHVADLGPGDSLLDAAVAYAIEHEDDY